MSKKVLITRKIPEIGISLLKEKGYEVEIGTKDSPLSEDELLDLLKKDSYDVVVTLLTDKIGEKVFESAPNVKLFANYATGFDNIDTVSAKQRGILVTNAPSIFSAKAVAEHTVALFFALSRKIVESNKYVREGKYLGWDPMNFIGGGILGKTLGLVGAGRIGEEVARMFFALGLKIIYFDVVRNERIEKDCKAEYFSEIEKMLPLADLISIHIPLLPSTEHLFNEKILRLLKREALLVNTSRGKVIDEKVLEKILSENLITGAGLDVFEFEPNVSDTLKNLSNVILTPHIASATIEAREDMAKITALNIIDFFEGRTPRNLVN